MNGWIKLIGSALLGVMFGALVTGFLSMAAFTSRQAGFEARLTGIETTQNNASEATKELTKATNELSSEVRLLRQRLNRLDPDGR